MKNKKALAVFELKYYYIDEDGNTDGKHYEYKGDHSSFSNVLIPIISNSALNCK